MCDKWGIPCVAADPAAAKRIAAASTGGSSEYASSWVRNWDDTLVLLVRGGAHLFGHPKGPCAFQLGLVECRPAGRLDRTRTYGGAARASKGRASQRVRERDPIPTPAVLCKVLRWEMGNEQVIGKSRSRVRNVCEPRDAVPSTGPLPSGRGAQPGASFQIRRSSTAGRSARRPPPTEPDVLRGAKVVYGDRSAGSWPISKKPDCRGTRSSSTVGAARLPSPGGTRHGADAAPRLRHSARRHAEGSNRPNRPSSFAHERFLPSSSRVANGTVASLVGVCVATLPRGNVGLRSLHGHGRAKTRPLHSVMLAGYDAASASAAISERRLLRRGRSDLVVISQRHTKANKSEQHNTIGRGPFVPCPSRRSIPPANVSSIVSNGATYDLCPRR